MAQTYKKIIFGTDRNTERPLDAIELLTKAAKEIEQLYEKERRNPVLPTLPFLIDAITIDLKDGLVAIFLRSNN
jgi:hypothetical protein